MSCHLEDVLGQVSHVLIRDRSFVLNELCDKVGTQDLGTSINNISVYLETRVAVLRNIEVCDYPSLC